MEFALKPMVSLIITLGESYLHGQLMLVKIFNRGVDYYTVPVIENRSYADIILKSLFGKKAKLYYEPNVDSLVQSFRRSNYGYLSIDVNKKGLKKFKKSLKFSFYENLKVSDKSLNIIKQSDNPILYPLLDELDNFMYELNNIENEEEWHNFLIDNCIYFLPLEFEKGKKMLLENMITFDDEWRDFYLSFDIPEIPKIYIDRDGNKLSYIKDENSIPFKPFSILLSKDLIFKRIDNL